MQRKGGEVGDVGMIKEKKVGREGGSGSVWRGGGGNRIVMRLYVLLQAVERRLVCYFMIIARVGDGRDVYTASTKR